MKTSLQQAIDMIRELQQPHLMSEAWQAYRNAENILLDLLPTEAPTQSLSIADLIALVNCINMVVEETPRDEIPEMMQNINAINIELSARYTQLFPNNKHFTL